MAAGGIAAIVAHALVVWAIASRLTATHAISLGSVITATAAVTPALTTNASPTLTPATATGTPSRSASTTATHGQPHPATTTTKPVDWARLSTMAHTEDDRLRQLLSTGQAEIGTDQFAAWSTAMDSNNGCENVWAAMRNLAPAAPQSTIVTWVSHCTSARDHMRAWGHDILSVNPPTPTDPTTLMESATATATLSLADLDADAIAKTQSG